MIFKPGTKTALVGESGSGKSTIIKLILGLNSNYSGSIKYDNFNTIVFLLERWLKLQHLLLMIVT